MEWLGLENKIPLKFATVNTIMVIIRFVGKNDYGKLSAISSYISN